MTVKNRGDYFSAIFGLALDGRPRLTSTRHDPRNAARRYSRPPRMPAFFAAAARPRRMKLDLSHPLEIGLAILHCQKWRGVSRKPALAGLSCISKRPNDRNPCNL